MRPVLGSGFGPAPRNEHAREQHLASLGAAIPLGRVGQPIEVAKLIAYLASDDAAFITGALVPIDGGNSAA